MGRVLVAASILLALLAGCDEPPTPGAPVGDSAAWHLGPDDQQQPEEPRWWRRQLLLPEAREARPEMLDPEKRLYVVNVLGNGDIRFKNNDWQLLAGTPVETQNALRAFEIDLRSLLARGAREDRGERRWGFVIHACRSAPWRAVMEVLRVWRRLPADLDELDICTEYEPSARTDGILAAHASAYEGPVGDANPFSVELVVEERAVRLRAGDRTYAFPAGRYLGPALAPGARRDAEIWIGEANGIWRAVAEDLAASPVVSTRASIRVLGKAGHRHVPHPAYDVGIIMGGDEEPEPSPPVPEPPALERITPEEELDWAYVVTAIDLLLAHGVREFVFPDLEIVLTFGDRHFDPPPQPFLEVGPSRTEVVLVVVFAVLAGVLVTLWGRPRGRAGTSRPDSGSSSPENGLPR